MKINTKNKYFGLSRIKIKKIQNFQNTKSRIHKYMKKKHPKITRFCMLAVSFCKKKTLMKILIIKLRPRLKIREA